MDPKVKNEHYRVLKLVIEEAQHSISETNALLQREDLVNHCSNYNDSYRAADDSTSDLQGSSKIFEPERPHFSWNELVSVANEKVEIGVTIEDLLTEAEINAAYDRLNHLRAEFNEIYKLDKLDYTICIGTALLSATVDILLVGIPHPSPDGLKAGKLSDWVRERFNQIIPPGFGEDDPRAKVPFDAPYNKGFTTEWVEGLNTYFHRLYSLGHDPVIGFVAGVLDIIHGTMTTIDKNGNFIVQPIPRNANRIQQDLFKAIAKEFFHLISDMTTSMGLPAPFMGLFNLFQFGSITEEELTIAEIVQGMYYEGYDFIHFCSMSIPVMITDVVVRIAYAIRQIKEGHSIKDSIPVSDDEEKHPKLGTMLFISHSGATAANAGKILFTKNPMAINYPQWIIFFIRAYKELVWQMYTRPNLRNASISDYYLDNMNSLVQSLPILSDTED